MQPDPRRSAAQATAEAIRRDVLRIAADGDFLGSEEELLERYGVSRPTLRQAARIVEHEQLITVRRGVNGGFFTRIPSSEAVSRVASVFLQVNGTAVDELFRSVSVILPALAAMACDAPIERRNAFADWVEQRRGDVATMRRREFLEHLAEHGRRLGELADCRPLALFQNVLMELTLAESTVNVFAQRSRIDEVADHQLELSDAIRRGDHDAARRLTEANEHRTAAWVGDAPPRRRD